MPRRFEPDGCGAAEAGGQAPMDERRGEADRDVAEADGQRERGGEVAPGHHDQEQHPEDSQGVREGDCIGNGYPPVEALRSSATGLPKRLILDSRLSDMRWSLRVTLTGRSRCPGARQVVDDLG